MVGSWEDGRKTEADCGDLVDSQGCSGEGQAASMAGCKAGVIPGPVHDRGGCGSSPDLF